MIRARRTQAHGCVHGGTGAAPRPPLPADVDAGGRFRHIVFRITAAEAVNQSLYITLSSPVQGHFYGDNSGRACTRRMAAERRACDRKCQPPGAHICRPCFESLAKALVATALTRWWFAGPFYDPHFTAGTRVVGPEAGTRVDLSASYADEFGSNASWRVLSIAGGTNVPNAISMPPDAAARAAIKSVAAFLCTRVFVPSLPGAVGGGTLLALMTGS